MIIEVYNRNRSTNRLVGYFHVGEHDFNTLLEKGKPKTVPNEFFYRKFRKALKQKWSTEFNFRMLEKPDIDQCLEDFNSKIMYFERMLNFYAKQQNRLQTLSNP